MNTSQRPFVSVTAANGFLHIVTDPNFVELAIAQARVDPKTSPMIPYGTTASKIGNVVMDSTIIGFSQEAIALIKNARLIADDLAIVSAWDSVAGPTVAWIGHPTMIFPQEILTITRETASYDFSKFRRIPNNVPNYSEWLRFLSS